MVRFNINDQRHWAFVCLVLIVSGIIALFGDAGRELLSYQNDLFDSREIWRAFSGHLTHLGWSHLLLNVFGLLGVWSMYGKMFNVLTWVGIFLVCTLGISAGFMIFDENLQTYVGLSGVLHGLLNAAAVNSTFSSRHIDKGFPLEDVFVLAALVLKISYEQFIGSVPLTGSLSGGIVVVNAHLYGAIIGMIVGGLISLFARIRHYKSPLSNDA